MIRFDGLVDLLHKNARFSGEDQGGMVENSLAFMSDVIVIRFPQHIVSIVESSPAPMPRNYNILRPIFPAIHVELEGGLKIDAEHIIDHLTIRCEPVTQENAGPEDKDDDRIAFGFGAYANGYKCNDISLRVIGCSTCLFFDANGDLLEDRVPNDWNKLSSIARNILDFLALPSVRVEPEPGMAKINRSRKKRNKAPLTDYHIIHWSDTSHPQSNVSDTGIKHHVRYDVRGNWATYTRGTLVGRRIWRRPHQRGPVDAPFRAKGYQR